MLGDGRAGRHGSSGSFGAGGSGWLDRELKAKSYVDGNGQEGQEIKAVLIRCYVSSREGIHV